MPIEECREPLVALSHYAPERITVEARYFAAGYPGALSECYLRAGVAERLAAAALLPAGWRFVVFDGWRPLAVQQHLFHSDLAALRREQPGAAEQALREQVLRYVALPSTDPRCPSPHATGGAVDLSLLDARGAAVSMGTPFDAFDERAATRHFERRLAEGARLTAAETRCLRNRRRLFHALQAVGFTNYPEEWWHFDCGNQFNARIAGGKARYGLAPPPT